MRSFLAGLRLDVQQRTGKTLESQEKTLSDIFFRCCEEGDIEMVKRFLEREGMHVNTQNPQSGWTALHFAAFRDDTLLIAFLVNHKADLEVVSSDGRTPLQVAVSRGKREAARTLLMLSGRPVAEIPHCSRPTRSCQRFSLKSRGFLPH
eukprot:RCo040485